MHSDPVPDVVGQVRVSGIAGEGELQHVHAWEIELLPKLKHILGDMAQILRNDGQFSQGILDGLEEELNKMLLH